MRIAAQKVRDLLIEEAAEQMEASGEDLVIEEGRIFVRGSPTRFGPTRS